MYDIEKLKGLMFTDYPDLVDINQLQKMLNINRHTAYDLVRSGDLPVAKVGRKYLIPKIAIIKHFFRNASSESLCRVTEVKAHE